jgi:hypothetical protein
MVPGAKREGDPDVKKEYRGDGDHDAQPIRAQAHGSDGDTPWGFPDGAGARVQIEVDPIPHRGEVVSHVQGHDRLVRLQQVLLDERVGIDSATGDDILPFEQIGFVAVVDACEISHAVHKGGSHTDIHALVRRQKIRSEHDRPADGVSAGFELDCELPGFDALLLRIAGSGRRSIARLRFSPWGRRRRSRRRGPRVGGGLGRQGRLLPIDQTRIGLLGRLRRRHGGHD